MYENSKFSEIVQVKNPEIQWDIEDFFDRASKLDQGFYSRKRLIWKKEISSFPRTQTPLHPPAPTNQLAEIIPTNLRLFSMYGDVLSLHHCRRCVCYCVWSSTL